VSLEGLAHVLARVVPAFLFSAALYGTISCGSGDDSAIPGADDGLEAGFDAGFDAANIAREADTDGGATDGRPSPDASRGQEGGAETGTPPDGGALNGCTPGPGGNFVDKSGGGSQFDFTTAVAQYTITTAPGKPPCMLIHKSQTVKWVGQVGATFKLVPLAPAGGTMPTPITPQNGNIATYQVTFPNAGVYGFDNPSHPTVMLGAVEVQ
jgi:hypothetical protein